MEKGNGPTQLDAIIGIVDEASPSPERRATVVWSLMKHHFPDLTDWDVLCFSVQFIAIMSQTWNWLEKDARSLNSLLYTAHYMMTGDHDISTGLKRDKPPTGGPIDRTPGPQENSTRSNAESSEHGRGHPHFKTSLHIHSRKD